MRTQGASGGRGGGAEVMRGVVAGVAALVLGAVLVACGTSCEEIRADRARFDERKGGAHGADARVVVPFGLLDEAIARHLGARPAVEVKLPVEKLGLSFALAAKVDAVRAREEAAGRMGVTADIGLYEGRERIASVQLESAVKPTLRRATAGRPARVVLELRKEHLGAIAPKTTPAGQKRLAQWLRGELPPVLRGLADDALVGLAADELLAYFASDVWPRVKGDVLGPEPVLFTTELTLPGLPIDDLAVRSATGALVLELTTALPVAASLGDALVVPAPGRLGLTLTGESAAELVNLGMQRGIVPARFGADGEPKPDGRWEARVAWRRDAASPLEVHLWQTQGECKHALVVGRLGLRVAGDTIKVTADGRLRRVQGPAFVEAFAWWEALWSDALDVVHDLASLLTLEIDGTHVAARVRHAAIDKKSLTVELEPSW